MCGASLLPPPWLWAKACCSWPTRQELLHRFGRGGAASAAKQSARALESQRLRRRGDRARRRRFGGISAGGRPSSRRRAADRAPCAPALSRTCRRYRRPADGERGPAVPAPCARSRQRRRRPPHACRSRPPRPAGARQPRAQTRRRGLGRVCAAVSSRTGVDSPWASSTAGSDRTPISAIRRFQRWAGLAVDGLAGPATLAALRGGAAARLADPALAARWTPRSETASARGAGASTRGSTSRRRGDAGRCRRPRPRRLGGAAEGGWGLLVTVAHSSGVRSMYAHLSRVAVRLGQHVDAGSRVGLVGSQRARARARTSTSRYGCAEPRSTR